MDGVADVGSPIILGTVSPTKAFPPCMYIPVHGVVDEPGQKKLAILLPCTLIV